jgi:hypothetical protein
MWHKSTFLVLLNYWILYGFCLFVCFFVSIFGMHSIHLSNTLRTCVHKRCNTSVHFFYIIALGVPTLSLPVEHMLKNKRTCYYTLVLYTFILKKTCYYTLVLYTFVLNCTMFWTLLCTGSDAVSLVGNKLSVETPVAWSMFVENQTNLSQIWNTVARWLCESCCSRCIALAIVLIECFVLLFLKYFFT